ncbi:hypothetical protein IT407_01830 [Candidatus Uhrbacteria bacterium]|nr:hypothetical protein [Candidatus Uhrbacteria bacterium]
MLSTGTDIVLRPYDPSENFIGRTPFERFMIGLGKRYRANAKSMSSAAEWTAFPYEQAVADGLWLVFIRTSERLGLKLTTSDHVMRDIAPRVNRVLNSAFHFVYQNVDEAVDAFESRVVRSVQNTDGASPASDAWALESARFFADILRAANETAALIQRLARKYHKLNTIRPLAGIEKSMSVLSGITDNSHLLDHVIGPISLGHETDRLANRDDALHVIRDLKLDLRQVRKFKTLPYRLNKVPEQAYPDEPFAVSKQWINTQLLLALCGAPVDAELVTGKQYMAGLFALKKLDTEEAIERFLARMNTRGMDQSDQGWLRPVIADRVDMMRSWSSRQLDLSNRNHLLIDLFNEQIDIENTWVSDTDVDSAMVFAEQAGINAARRAVIKQDWLSFTRDILEDHLEQGTLTTADVAANLGRLDTSVAEGMLPHLMARKDFDKKSFRRLVDAGFVELGSDVGFRYRDWLTQEELAEHLGGILSSVLINKHAEKYSLQVYEMLRKIPVATVRKALIDDVHGRVHGMILREELEADDLRIQEMARIKRKARTKAFDRMVGREASKMFVLASEVTIREKSYHQPGDPDFLVPWTELHKAPHQDSAFQDLSSRLGLARSTVAKLLKRTSEEDVLRWIYADSDHKSLSKLVRSYQDSREAYYKARPSR